MRSLKTKEKRSVETIVLEFGQARLQGDVDTAAIRVDTDMKEGRKFDWGKRGKRIFLHLEL